MTTTSQSINDIYQTAKEALVAYGATQSVAHHVADATARSESLGNVICGLAYLESYCIQLESGRVNGSVEPRVERQKPSAIYVDGGFGFAQPAFAAGLETAVTAAKENGVASLAVGHTHTCTSLGYFTGTSRREGCDLYRDDECFACCGGSGWQNARDRYEPDRTFSAGRRWRHGDAF
jgi:(2R)-3-sulfolactate dehydrogenase (NADP+)